MAHTQRLPAGGGADYKRVKGVSLFANVLPSSWQTFAIPMATSCQKDGKALPMGWQKGGCAAFISLYNEPDERGEG